MITVSHEIPRTAGSLLIGGEWIKAADERDFPTLDPATEAEIARAAWAGGEDVDRAVKAARRALDGEWRTLSPSARSRLIGRLADLVEANGKDLAWLETIDNGKPLKMAERVDVAQVVEYFRYYAGWPTKIDGETLPVSIPSTFVYTRKQPVGVCALIVPWNFPLLMTAYKLGPALAAGCTVILKPAEQTPLSALRLAELVQEAGFPDGVVNVLTGHGDTGQLLVEHPGVDKVSFTGSTAAGRDVAARAAGSLKRVTLELGGKNPTVVLPDADPDAVARGAYVAAYFNSGQVCQAGSRFYVHKDQFDDIVAAIADRARKAKVGPGVEPETQIGPVVSKEQHDRVIAFIESGLADGAELVVGAPELSVPDRGYFVAPTLFAGVSDGMAIAREEIFGPVLVAMPYDDLDDVVRRANDTEYGLTAYVWTRDIAQAHRVAERLDAGSVFVNMSNAGDPAAPFGGLKSSGLGRESGRAGLDAYLETKTVWTSLA